MWWKVMLILTRDSLGIAIMCCVYGVWSKEFLWYLCSRNGMCCHILWHDMSVQAGRAMGRSVGLWLSWAQNLPLASKFLSMESPFEVSRILLPVALHYPELRKGEGRVWLEEVGHQYQRMLWPWALCLALVPLLVFTFLVFLAVIIWTILFHKPLPLRQTDWHLWNRGPQFKFLLPSCSVRCISQNTQKSLVL